MRAVITVIGHDMVGILAKVSTECADCGANIMDVNQTVMQDVFAMIMLIDIAKMSCHLSELGDRLEKAVDGMGLKVHVMHQDIFDSMHRI